MARVLDRTPPPFSGATEDDELVDA